MAGKTFIDRLEKAIREEGARRVAEEIKDLLDICRDVKRDIVKRLSRSEKALKILAESNRDLRDRVSRLEQ